MADKKIMKNTILHEEYVQHKINLGDCVAPIKFTNRKIK